MFPIKSCCLRKEKHENGEMITSFTPAFETKSIPGMERAVARVGKRGASCPARRTDLDHRNIPGGVWQNVARMFLCTLNHETFWVTEMIVNVFSTVLTWDFKIENHS